jgi:hypothetical protein
MDKLQTYTGGHPLTLDDLDFIDGIYRDAFNSIFKAFINDTNSLIVSGCIPVGSSISAGFVLLNGELLKVDAHERTGDYYEKVETYYADVRVYKSGEQHQVYKKVRAVCSSNVSYGLAYNSRRFFGNASGQICEGNDPRLSDSRKCNNTFDNAATARYNIDSYSKTETNNSISYFLSMLDVYTTAQTNAQINASANNLINIINSLNPSGLITRYYEIGPWNMDASEFAYTANFNNLNPSKIIGYSAIIQHDDQTTKDHLLGAFNDVGNWSYGQIVMTSSSGNFSFSLRRPDGSIWDWEGCSSTAINRGWIVVQALP